jgi:hypothetical protein
MSLMVIDGSVADSVVASGLRSSDTNNSTTVAWAALGRTFFMKNNHSESIINQISTLILFLNLLGKQANQQVVGYIQLQISR